MLERYEMKFTIPSKMVRPMADYASIYCSQDRYSQQSEGGFYRVNNLYLDSPNYLFLRRRLERVPNRFNMRVRSYGDDPGLPYYLEVKQKAGDVIRKYRAPVTDAQWHKVFSEAGFTSDEPPGSAQQEQSRRLFERLTYSYQVTPKLLTQYVRNAWVSDIDDYARLTFDIDLRFMPRQEWDLVPREEQMVSYDLETLYNDGCDVILELKCYTSRVPLWMIDLIKRFDLKRRSFSKYLTGAAELFQMHRYHSAPRIARTWL